jgi:hypothetical protein
VEREADSDAQAQVARALWIALARPPHEARLADGVAFVEAQTELLVAEGHNEADAQHAALADFCHVLLNLSEFVYVD